MRFFHLSDLHIGLKLMNRDLREDQEYIFRQIIRLADYYRVSTDYLLGRTDVPAPYPPAKKK